MIEFLKLRACLVRIKGMARYFSQYCPSKFAAANVPVNYLPRQMLRQNESPRQLPRQFSMPRKLPGHFLGHFGELCGAEITGPKTLSGIFAAAKIITGTVFDLCSPSYIIMHCACVEL